VVIVEQTIQTTVLNTVKGTQNGAPSDSDTAAESTTDSGLLVRSGKPSVKRVEEKLPDDIVADGLTYASIDDTRQYRLVNDRYEVRVVTWKQLVSRWILARRWNLSTRLGGLGNVFGSFLRPEQAVKYRFDALQTVFSEGGKVPKPVHKTADCRLGLLVIERMGDTSSLRQQSLSRFNYEELYATLALFHDAGAVHGTLKTEMVLRQSTGQSFIGPPMGITGTNLTVGKAFDVATVIVETTPALGAWAVADLIADRYERDVLESIPPVIEALRNEFAHVDTWVIEQTRQAVESGL